MTGQGFVLVAVSGALQVLKRIGSSIVVTTLMRAIGGICFVKVFILIGDGQISGQPLYNMLAGGTFYWLSLWAMEAWRAMPASHEPPPKP